MGCRIALSLLLFKECHKHAAALCQDCFVFFPMLVAPTIPGHAMSAMIISPWPRRLQHSDTLQDFSLPLHGALPHARAETNRLFGQALLLAAVFA